MKNFTVEHHATLFALMAREAVACCDDEGREAIHEGVRRYGERRGARMADRARQDGRTNDLMSYLLYGELDFGSTPNRFAIAQRQPHFEVCAQVCAWDQIWRDKGLLDHGKLYCDQIDTSVMRGFDPAFHFEVDGTLSGGDDCCRFRFHDAGVSLVDLARYAVGKVWMGKQAIRSWHFHTCELYAVLSETLYEQFGDAKGGRAIASALDGFGDMFGEAMRAEVAGSRNE
jgi:hypothetical protein